MLDDSYSIGGEYFWGPYGNQNIINETSGIGVAVLGEGSFGYYRSVSQADHLRAGAGESFKACRDYKGGLISAGESDPLIKLFIVDTPGNREAKDVG